MPQKILYIQYTNPAGYPPLEHSSRILARDGWKVLFLGAVARGADLLRFPTHEDIEVRQITLSPTGWRQKLQYFRFFLWVVFWTFRWRPRWIYASDPLSCPIALLLSFLPGLGVVYHEHDSPSGTATSMWIHACLWARRQLTQRTKVCILPNQQRAERFSMDTGDGGDIVCVLNCPRIEEVGPLRQQPVTAGKLMVYYHGSIVPARLPNSLLAALAIVPETVKLTIVGYETVGHKGYLNDLRQYACQLGIANRVAFVGVLPTRKEVLQYCRGHDVGIVFITKDAGSVNRRHLTGASNKPFDYLASGLAVLVAELPDWQEMFVEPGYGYACDPNDSGSIAKALTWFLDHPEETRAMGQRGRQKIITDWNYEKQFEAVRKRIYANSITPESKR